jgi:2-polyprenyl-6-hydroxyphenyl methylase/3-demethylubiquinone-9 3-methyltransferase
MENYSTEELERFESVAAEWWDPKGKFRPLHQINPLRSNYIDEHSPVAGKTLLDIGCGGGLLCESMAYRGAKVTGIDLGENALGAARKHMKDSPLSIDYQQTDSAKFAQMHAGAFDIVCCLELLEHVPDPAQTVLDCAALVRPGGDIYFSTINRTPLAWLVAIVGAEYVLNLLPRGTHDYRQLIRPSELGTWIRSAGLLRKHISGMQYRPLSDSFELGRSVAVNYLMHVQKPN